MARTRTNAHQTRTPHPKGSKAQQTGGAAVRNEARRTSAFVEGQMLTSKEACRRSWVVYFCNACVIAWMKADYLQFRREELRRQRPAELAGGD